MGGRVVEEDVIIERPDWDDFYGFGEGGPIGGTPAWGASGPWGYGDNSEPFGGTGGGMW